MHTSAITINGLGGSIVKPLVYIILPVVYKEQSYRIRCEVVPNNIVKFNILTDVDSIKLGLIKRIMYLKVLNWLWTNISVFQGIGKLPGIY